MAFQIGPFPRKIREFDLSIAMRKLEFWSDENHLALSQVRSNTEAKFVARYCLTSRNDVWHF